MFASLLFASLAVTAAAAADQPQELSIGDPAPKLEIREFVRGEPFQEFVPGKVYVVDFWATSCKECRKTVPRLAKLQKKYKDVVFLGVSIDEDAKPVKPFVTKMAGKMDYRVAIEARDGDSGKMSRAWLDASFQGDIPATFVIDADGKVAWIGHPNDLEGPLKQILAGKWDLAAKAAEFKAAVAEEKQKAAEDDARKRLANRLAQALQAKKYDTALKAIEEAEAKKIDVRGDGLDPRVLHLAILVISGKQTDKAVKLGKALLKKTSADAEEDNAVSVLVAIVDPERIVGAETNPEEIRLVPPLKLEPALAKLAADAADQGRDDGADSILSPNADSDTPSSGFEVADAHLLLARAYQAAGRTEDADIEIKKATAALEQTVRRANEALDKARAMEKELGAPKE